MRILERRIMHMRHTALKELHARLQERMLAHEGRGFRFFELVDGEVQDRARDAAEDLFPDGDAYDATDDCYLYDRNNPLSPWAY
jgi:hypothetical protein